MRPARIGTLEGCEDEQQVERSREDQQPSRFAQQAGQLCRKGSAFARYAQGAYPPYSGSMIVSRTTMVEPRISM
jgi:hypothetical protein